MRRVDIYSLVSESVARAMDKARARQVNLQANLKVDVAALNVDPEKMGWVFDELLDNAIKFTGPGGRVEIALNQTGDLAVVSVMDTGIGISADHLPEVFEPFHQLDGSITRRFGGVGLGLSLARKIVEAHGAAISVQSEVGKGTHFTVALPIFDK
jgi:signal transduction histidine kinase